MSDRPIAFVTGGGRGIGRSIALELAADGHDVCVAARTTDELENVAAEIRHLGRSALVVGLDVTLGEQVEAALAACRDALGPPLVLVNNAGIAPAARFLDVEPETWDAVLRVNLTGAYLVTRAALPAMLEAGWGRIVNVASTAGKVGYRYTAPYTASKHGLLGLTRALALELAKKGITVNAVCPGFARTAITEAARDNIAKKTGRSPKEAEAELAAMSPLGRLVEPEEVARVVAHLVADEAAGITGQAWNIDGGSVMQ